MEAVNFLQSSPSTLFSSSSSSSSIITTKPKTHRKPKPISTNFTKLTTGNLKTHHYPLPTRRFTTKKTTLPPLQSTTSSSSSSSSNGGGEEKEETFNGRGIIVQVGEVLSLGLPILVGSATVLALWKPSTFLWVDRNLQIFGLTVTMLGMGMTLTLDDLKTVVLMPKQLVAGFFLQYTIMPLSGYFVSKLLNLPSYYAAGLILVGCCPGGTASNVVTYLARGNVALSVLMTAASTFAAAIMTPLLTSKLAGQFVSVDRAGLFISTVQVVLAPVLLGAVLNQYFNNLVKVVSPLMPLIAVTSVSILCGSAIAQNASAILASGLQVVVAVFTLHGAGFFLGYMFSRILGIDDSSSRTISIEVGMQNSLLGLVLANQHFGNPLTAVPCAVSSLCHLIYGSALAGIWRYFPPAKEGKELRSGDVTVS